MPHRVVFFGSADFAVPALQVVASDVVAVVTQPPRPSGRGGKLTPTPVQAAATELGLPVYTPEKAREASFVEFVESLDASYHLVAAYGQILSMRLLESARHGGINLHGSILPRYRGAAPIQHAILAGESETGVTLMQMDKGMDTGDVIAVQSLGIGPDTTYGQLTGELSRLAARMIGQWHERLATGNYPRVPQNHDLATYAGKIDRADCELSFARTTGEEYRRFRAFTPNPGTYYRTRFGRVRVSSIRPSGALQQGAGGEVVSVSPFTVAHLDQAMEWDLIQPEGRARMKASDWANGLRLRPGDRLIEGTLHTP